jgi:hypothetical protein
VIFNKNVNVLSKQHYSVGGGGAPLGAMPGQKCGGTGGNGSPRRGPEEQKNRNKPVDVMRVVIDWTMCRVLIMRANSFVPAISQSSQIDYAIISCFCDGSCAVFFCACALPSCGLCVSFRLACL